MTLHARRKRVFGLTMLLSVFAAGCGGGSDPAASTPTRAATAASTRTATMPAGVTVSATRTSAPTASPTATRMQGTSAVNGFLVVNQSITANAGDALGAPPARWTGEADAALFNKSLAAADWSVAEVPEKRGLTGSDGSFVISGLSPGTYRLQVTKTVDGNLLSADGQSYLSFPFSVGDGGSTNVVAEISLGLVKSISTYSDGTVHVRDVRTPYDGVLVTRDGRVSELGFGGRTLIDANGDGHFDAPACLDHIWDCPSSRDCGSDRLCSCTSSCPFCDDCGPGICVPKVPVAPYRCNPDDTCSQPGDRCVCVASCPECSDCERKVCVPACTPVEITNVTITGGSMQLVVGQQGNVSASALLSDGSQIDVTYLATWQSSNDGALTVDSWGNLTAHSVGVADLTATLGTLASTPWHVEVVERPTLQRIDIQNVSCFFPRGLPDDYGKQPPMTVPPVQGDVAQIPGCNPVVQIGATIQFRALGEFANGFYQDITDEVQWQVVPATVGDVVAGLFTARQAGQARLSAALGAVVSDPTDIRVVTQPSVIALSIYSDGGIIVALGGPGRSDAASPCPIVAEGSSPCCCPGPTADGSILPCDCAYSITVLRGDQLTFHANAQYDTGEYRDVTAAVTWRSNNTAAATIGSDGVMRAVQGGDATIDAVFHDSANNADFISNPVGVHVVNEATLQSLYIYQEGGDHVVSKGDQRFFKATGYYDVGFSRDVTKEATWISGDSTIGGFDMSGVFTARSAGVVQVRAALGAQQSESLQLEVFERSELSYCDPASINRAVWSDDFNRVIIESDCDHYSAPGVATLRYTVTETQPHGGIFNPCLDLYVFQGGTKIRTIREQGCGEPFLAAGAPGRDDEMVKYQLRAFWDLKDEQGNPVAAGTYTIYGRFYLYYDPVVSLDVTVVGAGEPLPTRTPTKTAPPTCTPPQCGPDDVLSCPRDCPSGCGVVCATPTPTKPPQPVCTPPPCASDETYYCPGECPGGCGTVCAKRTATPTPGDSCGDACIVGKFCRADFGGQTLFGVCDQHCRCFVEGTPTPPPVDQAGQCYVSPASCSGSSFVASQSKCCELSRTASVPLPVTWCPAESFDRATGTCSACSKPCETLPNPTPTPTAAGGLSDLIPTKAFVADPSGLPPCIDSPADLITRDFALGVCVSNLGTAAAGPFVLSVNGTERRVEGLAARSDQCVTGFTQAADVPVVSVVVDSGHEVAESNEENNVRRLDNPIITAPPPPCGGITYRLTAGSTLVWQLSPDGPTLTAPLSGAFTVVRAAPVEGNTIFRFAIRSIKFQASDVTITGSDGDITAIALTMPGSVSMTATVLIADQPIELSGDTQLSVLSGSPPTFSGLEICGAAGHMVTCDAIHNDTGYGYDLTIFAAPVP